jgi:hypothetical protein
MRNKLFLFASLLLLAASVGYSQATLSSTTLGAAVSDAKTQSIKVSSATSITAGTTILFVDEEAMSVNAISGTTATVTRGSNGTRASTHASGATVYHGQPNYFITKDKAEGSSCASTSELVLPVINITNGNRYNCISSAWVLENPFISLFTALSATPGTYRQIRGEVTTYSTMTSGNLVGVRGAVTVPASGSISSGVYLYGVQGKAIGSTGTISVGSGYFTGVFGQIDLSSTTVSGGHVAALIGNTYGTNSSTWPYVNNLYLENAGGGVINAQIQTFGKADYVFDIQTNVHTPEANTSCTPSAVTGATGGIKVLVDGTARWIPLAATCN